MPTPAQPHAQAQHPAPLHPAPLHCTAHPPVGAQGTSVEAADIEQLQAALPPALQGAAL